MYNLFSNERCTGNEFKIDYLSPHLPFGEQLIMLNVILLNVVMLNVVLLNVVLLNVVMLNVVMLKLSLC